MATFAGRYGPEGIEYPDGTHAVNRAVTVYLADGSTLAVLFNDRDRGSIVDNPVYTDELGNLSFWAEPGNYFCDIDEGHRFSVQIRLDPEEPAGSVTNGFTHVQSTPSATWVIPNPLGHYPGSVLIVVEDQEVTTDVLFPSISQITAIFASPYAGRAEIRS